MQDKPDTFICHASEDKEAIARPLHRELTQIGVNSWLDESEVRLGQSIRQKIDEGLATCRSGTVILSRIFFEKHWTQYEMDGIVQRLNSGEILIFPIRHGITVEEIRTYSPSLAGRSTWSSSDYTPEQIAAEIAHQLGNTKTAEPQAQHTTVPQPEAQQLTAPTSRSFGALYIAAAETPELEPHRKPEEEPHMGFATGTHPDWIPVLASNNELEYVIEGNLLRVQLSYGNSRSGPEVTAGILFSQPEPLN